MRFLQQAIFIGTGLLGFTAGAVLLTFSCGCPEPREYPPGTFDIVAASRSELIGGTVEADGELRISFTRDDGTDWLIVYDAAKP